MPRLSLPLYVIIVVLVIVITVSEAKLIKTNLFILSPHSSTRTTTTIAQASTSANQPDFDLWFRLGTRLRDVYIRSHRLVSSRYDASEAVFGTIHDGASSLDSRRGQRGRQGEEEIELIRLAEALGMGVYQEEFSSTKLGIVPGDLITVAPRTRRRFACDRDEADDEEARTQEEIGTLKARLLHEVTSNSRDCTMCVYLVSDAQEDDDGNDDNDDQNPVSRRRSHGGGIFQRVLQTMVASQPSEEEENEQSRRDSSLPRVFAFELHESRAGGDRYLKIFRNFKQILPVVPSGNPLIFTEEEDSNGWLKGCEAGYCSVASILASPRNRVMSGEDLNRACSSLMMMSGISTTASSGSQQIAGVGNGTGEVSSSEAGMGGNPDGSRDTNSDSNDNNKQDVLIFSDEEKSNNNGGGSSSSSSSGEANQVEDEATTTHKKQGPLDDDFRKGFIFGVGISLCVAACFMGGGGGGTGKASGIAKRNEEDVYGAFPEVGEEHLGGEEEEETDEDEHDGAWRQREAFGGRRREDEIRERFFTTTSSSAVDALESDGDVYGKPANESVTPAEGSAFVPPAKEVVGPQHVHIPRPRRGATVPSATAMGGGSTITATSTSMRSNDNSGEEMA